METYVAALDQGTTSSRAILFSRRGEIVSRAQYPFRQIYPPPGWVEHDPMEIWQTEKRALQEAVDSADFTAFDDMIAELQRLEAELKKPDCAIET